MFIENVTNSYYRLAAKWNTKVPINLKTNLKYLIRSIDKRTEKYLNMVTG